MLDGLYIICSHWFFFSQILPSLFFVTVYFCLAEFSFDFVMTFSFLLLQDQLFTLDPWFVHPSRYCFLCGFHGNSYSVEDHEYALDSLPLPSSLPPLAPFGIDVFIVIFLIHSSTWDGWIPPSPSLSLYLPPCVFRLHCRSQFDEKDDEESRQGDVVFIGKAGWCVDVRGKKLNVKCKPLFFYWESREQTLRDNGQSASLSGHSGFVVIVNIIHTTSICTITSSPSLSPWLSPQPPLLYTTLSLLSSQRQTYK